MSACFFIPFTGNVHLFDWDEINFAEAAREMIHTGNYLTVQIDYTAFHEKPPFFIWMQVISMKIFGINEFAARFPNAIIGIITLLTLYIIAKKHFDEKFALMWVFAYLGSFLPHFYFKSGIIDPTFNLLIFLSVYFLFRHYNLILNQSNLPILNKKTDQVSKYIVFAGLANALAVLTKGPTGFLLAIITFFVFVFLNKSKIKFPFKSILAFSSIALSLFVIWYALVLINADSKLVQQFIDYHIRLLTTRDAGHGGPIYYHVLIILIACFPSSIFAYSMIRKREFANHVQENYLQIKEKNLFLQFSQILFFVVLTIFSLVNTKIVHYSSLTYFHVCLMATYFFYMLDKGEIKFANSKKVIYSIFSLIWVFLFAAFPIVLINISKVLPKVTDKFTHALLQAEVGWTGYESSVGIIMFLGSAITIYFFLKRKYDLGFYSMNLAVAFTIFLFLPMLAPRIEGYTQNAPIKFFESLRGKDCYLRVLGYKSYAQYFYSDLQSNQSLNTKHIEDGKQEEYLLKGAIDKDAYFVCQNKIESDFLKDSTQTGIFKLYEKNGFVFMKRNAVHKN